MLALEYCKLYSSDINTNSCNNLISYGVHNIFCSICISETPTRCPQYSHGNQPVHCVPRLRTTDLGFVVSTVHPHVAFYGSTEGFRTTRARETRQMRPFVGETIIVRSTRLDPDRFNK
jgi:hypothetical protein